MYGRFCSAYGRTHTNTHTHIPVTFIIILPFAMRPSGVFKLTNVVGCECVFIMSIPTVLHTLCEHTSDIRVDEPNWANQTHTHKHKHDSCPPRDHLHQRPRGWR